MTAGPTRARTPTAAQQLALDLPVSLPAIEIEPEWKAQQRLWGHSFHPMCSYLASFPAALAHAFIARYSRPGDVVLDPFSVAAPRRCRHAPRVASASATTSIPSPTS